MKVAIICGGPSLERGISLNSARSVLDHLSSREIEVIPVYLDSQKNAYAISKAQLYSNTPSDFDFKLRQAGTPLSPASLARFLKRADIVFPVMHGHFGEDGGIQRFLEHHRIPFVGSDSRTCERAFDKFDANEFIRAHGFFALPSAVLKIYHRDHRAIIKQFFEAHRVRRAVVKPARGGSSIGVFSVATPKEALEKVRLIFSKRMATRVVIEPFAEGTEFTTIILQNRFGTPVALPPTEIETDYTQHQIFDFRRKYLPTRQVIWHCPPRFDNHVIERIQAQAEQLFALFNVRDFGRFDGWVLPDGNIWFSDFNTVSGMEQNSFLFQQAARIGMTHADVLQHILRNACARNRIAFPGKKTEAPAKRKEVRVLFGGNTSERQVSLMSGTNVWLKLRGSSRYRPIPYLLDTKGGVWRLPYHLALNHTVEEITANCTQYPRAKERLDAFEARARLRLGLQEEKNQEEFFVPEKMTLREFLKGASFVFNALHGGVGEDGTLQALFEKCGVRYNGPDGKASRLCMDKRATSIAVDTMGIKGVRAIPGTTVKTEFLLRMDVTGVQKFWKKTRKELGTRTIVIKPRADGCSTGVVHLYSLNDLGKYIRLLAAHAPRASKNTFAHQPEIIEMPPETPAELLFERFVETDTLKVVHHTLKHHRKTGWLEITVGVVEKAGELHALNPSITVAEGEVLSVEEKFQGGTGVNITPPPEILMAPRVLRRVKERIETVAAHLGIRGYSRLDAFAHLSTGNLFIIEVNTLPGITPSTVFYHQALAERPPLFPREVLELLIANKGY
ncbi:MAG: hypothetical protein HYY10_04190 [Candidatus Liptonbacteria bacterium]|nr:hypothetical protein [Candidatus Liptonbacteria bacterium]